MSTTAGSAAGSISGSGQGAGSQASLTSQKSGDRGKYSVKDHLTDHELREFKEIFSLVDTVRRLRPAGFRAVQHV